MAYAAGIVVTLLLSFFAVGRFVDYIEQQVRAQFNMDPQTVVRTRGDFELGILECVIFYASFAMGSAGLAAAWLGFKTAAKWKSWGLIADAQKENPQDPHDVSLRYRVFLIGTAANIVVGLAGFAVSAALGIR